jgi:hypothetical protein
MQSLSLEQLPGVGISHCPPLPPVEPPLEPPGPVHAPFWQSRSPQHWDVVAQAPPTGLQQSPVLLEYGVQATPGQHVSTPEWTAQVSPPKVHCPPLPPPVEPPLVELPPLEPPEAVPLLPVVWPPSPTSPVAT